MNNKEGLSPTPNQLLDALDHMESYVKAACEKNHPDDVKEYTKVKALSRQDMNDIDQFKGFIRKKLDLAGANKKLFAKYMWHEVEVPETPPSTPLTGKGKPKLRSPHRLTRETTPTPRRRRRRTRNGCGGTAVRTSLR
jgi:hypothetical protein